MSIRTPLPAYITNGLSGNLTGTLGFAGRKPCTSASRWIRSLNKNARRPDLTVVLDVPAEVAVTRREARGDAAQLYEQNELQRALCVFYKDLQRHIPNDRVVVVDGSGNIDATAEKVYAAYKAALQ